MIAESPLLQVAFDWYVSSYHLTRRQRQIGRRFSLGEIECVHFEYSWQDQLKQADNFFVLGGKAKSVVGAIRAYGPADDHQIYVVADRPGLQVDYLSLDCRVMSPAGSLMARDLKNLPVPEIPLDLFRPESAGDAFYLNTIDGADLTLAEDLVDQRLHFFCALDGDKPASMARLARQDPGSAWVSHVYTAPGSRGKGFATALMSEVLAEQKRAGDSLSLLLATPGAHSLYRRLGYQDVATVLNFVLA